MTQRCRLGSLVIVVLGGNLQKDDTPGPETILRAIAGVTLAEKHPRAGIILTGDGRRVCTNPATAHTEAQHLARLMRTMGIGRQLLLDNDAQDTLGNAVMVAVKFLHGKRPRKLYVVTSPFHLERSMLCFKGVLGPRWDIEAVASGPSHDDARRVATESGGIEWTKRFFHGIVPGDLVAIAGKVLREGKPYYRTVPDLTRLVDRVA